MVVQNGKTAIVTDVAGGIDAAIALGCDSDRVLRSKMPGVRPTARSTLRMQPAEWPKQR